MTQRNLVIFIGISWLGSFAIGIVHMAQDTKEARARFDGSSRQKEQQLLDDYYGKARPYIFNKKYLDAWRS